MTTLTDTAELTISTTVWDDPLAAGGLDADSDDALVYLTPILGPTATLLLHRLARYLTGELTAQTWTISELAASLGVMPSTLTATLARLDRFGMIRVTGDRTQVRTRIPPLSARHLSRLPAYLAVACPYQHSH